jgi:hypothetical protein
LLITSGDTRGPDHRCKNVLARAGFTRDWCRVGNREGNKRTGRLPGAVGHASDGQPTHHARVDRPEHVGARCDREDLARELGGQGTLKGADRFVEGQWTTLKTGAPALIGAVGVLDCELEEAIERHGTTIAIGKIVAFTQGADVQPLISFGGKYI